jgi:hypothetical protein
VKEGGAIYCTWSETRDFAEICSEGELFFVLNITNSVLFLAIFLENDLESGGILLPRIPCVTSTGGIQVLKSGKDSSKCDVNENGSSGCDLDSAPIQGNNLIAKRWYYAKKSSAHPFLNEKFAFLFLNWHWAVL